MDKWKCCGSREVQVRRKRERPEYSGCYTHLPCPKQRPLNWICTSYRGSLHKITYSSGNSSKTVEIAGNYHRRNILENGVLKGFHWSVDTPPRRTMPDSDAQAQSHLLIHQRWTQILQATGHPATPLPPAPTELFSPVGVLPSFRFYAC